MTPNDVIKSALSLLGVLAESETPTAEQASDGLDALNDMLASWETQGLDLGHYEVDLNDEMTISPQARKGVKYNLALEIAPNYEIEPKMIVSLHARQAYASLFACNHEIQDKVLDSTLTDHGTHYNINTD